MKLVIFAVSLIFLSLLSNSQTNVEFVKSNFKDNKKGYFDAIENLNKGDEYFSMGGRVYPIALPYYLKANSFNPDNAELNNKIGICYLNAANKDSALSYFLKAYAINPEISEDIHLNIGRALHYQKKFDEAIAEYKLQLIQNKGDESRVEIINKYIHECMFGKDMVANPVDVDIENVGKEINSPFPDYRPLISADESMMIFTSRRSDAIGGNRLAYDNFYYEDIYVSYFQDGKWSAAENIGEPLNTNNHDAAVGLSPNGQELFLFQGATNGGDIILCQLYGNEWERTEQLQDVINTEYWESSASFSFDGKSLYFVSNRPEGYGGRDIYRCFMDSSGNWSKPENLGSKINTKYDEASIFLHPDGKTLYFSSKGHDGMGGFDIFRTNMNDEGIWQEPVNLGYPVNTPDDDVFFILSASGEHGYYSSIRPGGYGEKDIYQITFKDTSDTRYPPVKLVAKLTLLKGTVRDAVTLEPLEAEVEIVDNEANKVIFTSKSNSSTGKYLVSLPSGKNYGIAVKSEGYLFHSENINIADTAEYQEIIKDIELNKIQVGSRIVLKNIFFDFDKATLRKESLTELNRLLKLLNEYPNIRIEISGHTDNKGSFEYNTQLSKSRAKAVVDYLVKKGISVSRIEYKGYAFSQPIASNNTDEGRQLNRRVEFKILSE